MKEFASKLAAIREALTKERPSGAVDATLDWLTFLVSLVPVPGVAESAAIANKIMNDRALNSRFDGIVAEISKFNDRIQQMESGLQRVELIGATVKDNTAIHSLLIGFFGELKSKTTEFSVETSDWSTQQIIRTLIDADWVSISATNRSQNLIDETHVTSKKASLIAKGGSRNVIRDSSFGGDKGSVTMAGQHTQQGNVSLEGPSVTYQGPNSQTETGGWYMGTDHKGDFVMSSKGKPFMSVSTTPLYRIRCRCGHERQMKGTELTGQTNLTCPSCGAVAPIPPLP